ncbi:hypothetical protein Tco_0676133 [Tanacetum coccineum]
MMNYLKNQGTWKITQLKKLSFEEVKEEFDKLVKQIESFAPISFEATKASLKRFGEELQTKTPKRLKEEKDDEAKDDESTKKSGKRRKQMARKGMNTNVDENDSEDSDKVDEQEETNTGTETPINPVPVAMKTPSVATYKIIKQGEKGVYQIVREDGTDIVYINFGAMLKSISRDDLTELYRIVMNRYGMDGPEDKLEKGFWKCLRIMEHMLALRIQEVYIVCRKKNPTIRLRTNGGGWISSVLDSSVSFVTSLSFSTTGGGIGGPSYETPLRVVIALALFLRFGMVLLGKELELEGPTSGIRATKGTLHKIEHRSKPFIPPNQIIMSANDNFSLHDDEELSLHDDASLDGSVPASNKGDAPAKPPQIITTNTLSNIKLPVLQKDDYDTWAMEMEHYLEYIDNEVWKVIQNGNSKKRVTKEDPDYTIYHAKLR